MILITNKLAIRFPYHYTNNILLFVHNYYQNLELLDN